MIELEQLVRGAVQAAGYIDRSLRGDGRQIHGRGTRARGLQSMGTDSRGGYGLRSVRGGGVYRVVP